MVGVEMSPLVKPHIELDKEKDGCCHGCSLSRHLQHRFHTSREGEPFYQKINKANQSGLRDPIFTKDGKRAVGVVFDRSGERRPDQGIS